MNDTQLLVVCGVSGCGKTTIGKSLAERLNYLFIDADDYHPEENRILMSNGIGLNDEQRLPWLLNLHSTLKEMKQKHQNTVLACSALKSKYRKFLNSGLDTNNTLSIKFILLKIEYNLVENRLLARKHDFVKGASILKSQFECLEINDDFFYIINLTEEKHTEKCVDELVDNLNK